MIKAAQTRTSFREVAGFVRNVPLNDAPTTTTYFEIRKVLSGAPSLFSVVLPVVWGRGWLHCQFVCTSAGECV